MNGFIKVTVGRLPGETTEITLHVASSVQDALDFLDLKVEENEQVNVNGEACRNRNDELKNKDCVFITKQLKGNLGTQVTVSFVPGVVKTITMNGGCKVKDALGAYEEVVGISRPDNFQVMVNGSVATLEDNLRERDNVLITSQIKGN